jgi:ABC-type lipopolysaccharide export system ATPase subunit
MALSRLHKKFGTKTAVDCVDLAVPRGSFFGLVGPSCAGKTTPLSMAVGLLRPDAGGAQTFSVDVWQHPAQAKSMVGALPDGLSIPERLNSQPGFTLKLRALGIDARTARNASLISLANDLPTTILADVVGMHTTTAERWAHLAKRGLQGGRSDAAPHDGRTVPGGAASSRRAATTAR